MPEALVLQESPKRLGADATTTNVLMPIDTTAEGLLRVIEMKQLEALESNDSLELVENVDIAGRRDDVVARRNHMTGVETDTQPGRVIDAVDDRPEVLETVTEDRALTGGLLQQETRRPRRLGCKDLRDRLRDPYQPFVLGARGVGTRV